MNRKEIISFIMNLIHKFSGKTNISINSLSHLLRSFHLSTPFFMLLLVFYSNIYISSFVLLFMIKIIICFVYLKGCYLSMIEKELFNDDFMITDPVLEIMKMEKNKKNRYGITFIIGGIYTVVLFTIYYLRFV